VPEPFAAGYIPPVYDEQRDNEGHPLPAAISSELALQPELPYSTTWSVPTIP
jgi:hypothetical protein